MLKKMVSIVLWSGLLFSMVFGTNTIQVNLSGTVSDSNDNVIPGAVVHLVKLNLWDTTDGNGKFSIVNDAPVSANMKPLEQISSMPIVRQGHVFFSVVERPAMVSVTLYDFKGRIICTVVDRELPEGTYNMPIAGKGLLTGQIYIAAITIGNSNTLIKTTALESGAFSGGQKSVLTLLGNTAIAKIQPSAPAVDTIVIEKIGFVNLTVPINSYESQLGTQNVKSSTMVAAAP